MIARQRSIQLAGFSAIDRRTVAARETLAFRRELIPAQGGTYPLPEVVELHGGRIRAPSRPPLPGAARRHLVQILLQILDLRAAFFDGDPHEVPDR